VVTLIFSACGSQSNDMIKTDTTTTQSETDTTTTQSETDSAIVEFPENYEDGILYTTVDRGNTHEKLYTSRETIEAVQKGLPIPSGSVIALEIYRDGELSDIFVSEKRSDWGDETPPEERNGDWRYQAFYPDRSLVDQSKIGSCISCHASQAQDEYVYTLERMKSFELEDITGSIDDSTKGNIESITLEEVHALANYLAELK
jgi:hypothetical protein